MALESQLVHRQEIDSTFASRRVPDVRACSVPRRHEEAVSGRLDQSLRLTNLVSNLPHKSGSSLGIPERTVRFGTRFVSEEKIMAHMSQTCEIANTLLYSLLI